MIAGLSALVQGYRRTTVIDGLDLEVSVGALGLLGPNGAGKTTLLKTLATVLPPRGGTLTLFGQQTTDEADVRRARRQIGYLPQDFGYPPAFTVYDFVRYAAWLREVPRGRAKALVLEALAAVNLQDSAKRTMKSLSGGMIQRAGIASAIVGGPKLLLLDEPSVGLDPAQRLEFRELMRSLDGTAVVLSTHLVEDVEAMCDTVAVMGAGRILFAGSPADLAGAATPGIPGDTPLERGYMTVVLGERQVLVR